MTTLAFFDITPGGGGGMGGPTLDDVRVFPTPTFVGPATWSEDGFAATLALPTSGTCTIEAATNLALNPAPWEQVTNFVITSTPVRFTDASATNHPVLFYRLNVTGP